MLRIIRFVALLSGALALTMTSAHVLELPQKIKYNSELYTAVNTTLYKYFAVVGGIYCIITILCCATLAIMLRHFKSTFWWSLIATVFFILWFASWLLIVEPVNNQIAQVIRTDPENVSTLWMLMREQWEYGHVVGFILQTVGFMCLVISILADTPARLKEKKYWKRIQVVPPTLLKS
jgi:hypothetical protein